MTQKETVELALMQKDIKTLLVMMEDANRKSDKLCKTVYGNGDAGLDEIARNHDSRIANIENRAENRKSFWLKAGLAIIGNSAVVAAVVKLLS